MRRTAPPSRMTNARRSTNSSARRACSTAWSTSTRQRSIRRPAASSRSSCPKARPAGRATSSTPTAPAISPWEWRSTSTCSRPKRRAADRRDAMHKVEIRPGGWIPYEDDWFGQPWSVPETVGMVHGNSESSRAWVSWVTHLPAQYRVLPLDLPGFGASTEPPGYGWSAGELAADVARFLDVLKIQTCHLIGAKYGGAVVFQPPPEPPHPRHPLFPFTAP